MEEKLNRLYEECINELKSININLEEENIGKIDISLSKRKNKRYGCCKQEEPDKTSSYRKNRIIHYRKYNKHHIEISKWLMNLNDDIIKNTIMHEIIHCFPDCNNHGKEFKKYSEFINEKLGYNISRLGNKEEDYKKSNLKFEKTIPCYKYEIRCQICNYVYYRQRLTKNFTKKYRCGNCKGKLKIVEEINKNI